MAEDRFGCSQRRACEIIGQPRSTQRLPEPVVTDDEAELRRFLRNFATARPRWGWKRAYVAAREAGWRVNRKRIQRLWRSEGLKVPYRRRKKRLTGIGATVGPFCPIRPNVVWAADFQFDQTRDGRQLKILNIVDEFTREALSTRTERSIDADDVVATLDKIAGERGFPAYVRFDHGPEFVAAHSLLLVGRPEPALGQAIHAFLADTDRLAADLETDRRLGLLYRRTAPPSGRDSHASVER
jgi:putative transposase